VTLGIAPGGEAAWVGAGLAAGGTVWLWPGPALLDGVPAVHAAMLRVAAKQRLRSRIHRLIVVVRIARLLMRF
jgi:hypothetical protein